MLGLPGETWIRFAVWLAIGLIIYWSYSYRHSRLHKPPGPPGPPAAPPGLSRP